MTKHLQNKLDKLGNWAALLACLLALHQVALAQFGTATAAPSCPTGCQPITGIRAESSDNGSSLQIKVTWELANLPATVKATGFTVIAKGRTESGRERENSINVGPSARTATIILNDFRRNDLDTFRARVVGRFELTRGGSIQATVRKKEIVAAGRDVFLDIEWDNVPSGLSPCEFQGFFVKGSARTDNGKEIEGAQSTSDRNARKLRLPLRGRDGINPTFVSTRATVELIMSGAIECGLSSGDIREQQTGSNATISRADAEAVLRQETQLISAISSGSNVIANVRLSNQAFSLFEGGGVIVCPVRANGAVDDGQICRFGNLKVTDTKTTISISQQSLSGASSGGNPVVAFDVSMQATYRVRNDLIRITIPAIRIKLNSSVPVASTGSNATSPATPSTAAAASGTVPQKASSNAAAGVSGSVGKAESNRPPVKSSKK